MKFSLLIAVAISLLVLGVGPSFATELRGVRIVAWDDNSFVRKTAKSLAERLQQIDPGMEVELSTATGSPVANPSERGRQLVVLIGERAFDSADAGGLPVLAIVPQRARTNAEKKYPLLSVIYFEQPLPRLFNLARLFKAPQAADKTNMLGIVASPETQKLMSSALSIASERNFTLHIETVTSELDVGKAVARVTEDAGVLVAIPDSVVHNANTVQSVLLLTYRAGVPVIGYSAAYLRAGAAVAVYSSPEQLARQTAESIAAIRENRPPPAMQWPRYFSVGVNSTVARSLGISLPDAEELEKRLATMKE